MRALIWGITGQTSSYLAEHLLEKGFEVIGVARRVSSPNNSRIRHIQSDRFSVVQGDVTDPFCVFRIIKETRPTHVFCLAAQSHVGTSFGEPAHTWSVTAGGLLNILEVVRSQMDEGGFPAKVYQASSSEMFGSSVDPDGFQRESTPFHPCSPYAIAKLAAHHLCRVYRESYGLFVCSGILMNHESPRRSEEFVTRKITRYVAGLARARLFGESYPELRLGNIEAFRDWGAAPDYVRAMLLMLEQKQADDYVIATGETHSVREFLEEAFRLVGIDNPLEYVVFDPSLYRPCEVKHLKGDASKARKKLGWAPTVSFRELVRLMVEADLEAIGLDLDAVTAETGVSLEGELLSEK